MYIITDYFRTFTKTWQQFQKRKFASQILSMGGSRLRSTAHYRKYTQKIKNKVMFCFFNHWIFGFFSLCRQSGNWPIELHSFKRLAVSVEKILSFSHYFLDALVSMSVNESLRRQCNFSSIEDYYVQCNGSNVELKSICQPFSYVFWFFVQIFFWDI